KLIYFFFQAEDGIRDDLVTGVQTCALPISIGCSRVRSSRRRWMLIPSGKSRRGSKRSSRRPIAKKQRSKSASVLKNSIRAFCRRSEERRVGKECRSGWVREVEKRNGRRCVA